MPSFVETAKTIEQLNPATMKEKLDFCKRIQ